MINDTDFEQIKINISQVVKERLPKYWDYIPRPLLKLLSDLCQQNKLNDLLRNNMGLSGVDFCRAILRDLNVQGRFHNEELLPDISNPRVLFVGNHPLGALDGMLMIDYLSKRYNRPAKFMVNDLLLYVKPLRPVFLGVNKFGSQSKITASAVDEAFESDTPMMIFPAGFCSLPSPSGYIRDTKWHRMFVKKCIQHNRMVVPLYFDGLNSPLFYKMANLRRALGFKTTLEILLTPYEMFRNRDKVFDIHFGQPFTPEQLAESPVDISTLRVKEAVYDIKSKLYLPG